MKKKKNYFGETLSRTCQLITILTAFVYAAYYIANTVYNYNQKLYLLNSDIAQFKDTVNMRFDHIETMIKTHNREDDETLSQLQKTHTA